MRKTQAYIVGALLVFGSALWSALFAQSISAVIAIIALPAVIAGYIYATELPQYVWGMLLGFCAYMALEYQLYGPVYKVTGVIYAISFFLALGAAMLGYFIYRKKNAWLAKQQ